jgi:hypothetical protein
VEFYIGAKSWAKNVSYFMRKIAGLSKAFIHNQAQSIFF